MIHVELHYLNSAFRPTGTTLIKPFVNSGEFKSWYKIAKLDPYCIIEVRYYDPDKDNLKKKYMDAMITKTLEFIYEN